VLRLDWTIGRQIAATLYLIMAAGGCSSDDVLGLRPVISSDSAAALEADEAGVDRLFSVVPLRTPDGYHQTVHPDYAMMPGWSPRRFLVATPYAFSQTHLENPSLYAQNPDYEWVTHGSNPVVEPGSGYLSDPDLVAVQELNELWIYYRQVTKRNTIWLIRSSDGLHWGDAVKVVSAPRQMVVSPSVVRLSRHDWMMWSVNAGKDGCEANSTFIELRRSTDGVNWTPPIEVTLAQPPFSIWHIEVQWIPSRQEFWAVYNVKNAGNCNTEMLFLATSPDGVTWKTYPSPLLRAGAIPEFKEIVYRSTFAYNPRTDNIRFWFSGAHYEPHGYVWQTVYQKRTRADVFATITRETEQQLSFRRGHEAPRLVNPP
jgi:hypothetical protein